MKILLFRIKLKIYKIYKIILLLWKFYLLFSKYWKWFNFLLMVWVMPLDSRNLIAIFNVFLNEDGALEDDGVKEPKSETTRRLENLFYITVIGFIAIVIYFTFFDGSGEGIDLSGFRRIVPEEPTKYSVNNEGDLFVSLLDEKFDSTTASDAAPPIISKHW